MAKKKNAEQGMPAAVKALEAGAPVPPLTPKAEAAVWEDITREELNVTDVETKAAQLKILLNARFPVCKRCSEYMQTKKRGVHLKYTNAGVKAANNLRDGMEMIEKAIAVMKNDGAEYFKPSKQLIKFAKEEKGVAIVEPPAPANAPDPGHVTAATAATAAAVASEPKKRGRKPKAAAAAAEAPAEAPKKRGRKPKAAAPAAEAPAAETPKKGKGKGKGKKAAEHAHGHLTEMDIALLDAAKADDDQRAKYASLATHAEKIKYINKIKSGAKAAATRKKNKKAEGGEAPVKAARAPRKAE